MDSKLEKAVKKMGEAFTGPSPTEEYYRKEKLVLEINQILGYALVESTHLSESGLESVKRYLLSYYDPCSTDLRSAMVRETLRKRYVVGLVFNKDLSRILMLLRAKDPYAGHFNGIGGKIEFGETPEQAMMREFKEKVQTYNSTEAVVDKVQHIVTFNLHSGVELHSFYLITSTPMGLFKTRTDEGVLTWFEPRDFLSVTNNMLAGEGNIPYLINYAYILEGRMFL